MRTETRLLVWWLLFGGSHVLLSSLPVRGRLIGALGLRGFKALYSVVALVTFVGLFHAYWVDRHAGALLFDPPVWLRHGTELVMLVAFLFVVPAYATPSPATTAAEMGGPRPASPRGIHRVTRHPSNTGWALFGLAHMLVNPTAGDWIFWGGFPVFALVSAWHQDRRLLRTGPPEFRTFYAETSLVPFAAILGGRQRFVASEFRWVLVAIAVVLWIAMRLVHPRLIGGFA